MSTKLLTTFIRKIFSGKHVVQDTATVASDIVTSGKSAIAKPNSVVDLAREVAESRKISEMNLLAQQTAKNTVTPQELIRLSQQRGSVKLDKLPYGMELVESGAYGTPVRGISTFEHTDVDKSIQAYLKSAPSLGKYSRTVEYSDGSLIKVLSNGDIVHIAQEDGKTIRRVYRNGELMIDNVKTFKTEQTENLVKKVKESVTDYLFKLKTGKVQIKGVNRTSEKVTDLNGQFVESKRIKDYGTVYETSLTEPWKQTEVKKIGKKILTKKAGTKTTTLDVYINDVKRTSTVDNHSYVLRCDGPVNAHVSAAYDDTTTLFDTSGKPVATKSGTYTDANYYQSELPSWRY